MQCIYAYSVYIFSCYFSHLFIFCLAHSYSCALRSVLYSLNSSNESFESVTLFCILMAECLFIFCVERMKKCNKKKYRLVIIRDAYLHTLWNYKKAIQGHLPCLTFKLSHSVAYSAYRVICIVTFFCRWILEFKFARLWMIFIWRLLA